MTLSRKFSEEKQTNKGLVLIITGASGSGKTSIKNLLLQSDNSCVEVVTVTTRYKRDGEIEGVDRFFKTPEEFRNMLSDDEFVTHYELYGNMYGVPKKSVEAIINKGLTAVITMGCKGAIPFVEKFPNDKVVSIFISPPSMEELDRRIRKRNSETEENLALRMQVAKEIMEEHSNVFDHNVVNDKIDFTLSQVQNIIKKERQNCSHTPQQSGVLRARKLNY